VLAAAWARSEERPNCISKLAGPPGRNESQFSTAHGEQGAYTDGCKHNLLQSAYILCQGKHNSDFRVDRLIADCKPQIVEQFTVRYIISVETSTRPQALHTIATLSAVAASFVGAAASVWNAAASLGRTQSASAAPPTCIETTRDSRPLLYDGLNRPALRQCSASQNEHVLPEQAQACASCHHAMATMAAQYSKSPTKSKAQTLTLRSPRSG
jgi:hypothetical protein